MLHLKSTLLKELTLDEACMINMFELLSHPSSEVVLEAVRVIRSVLYLNLKQLP